MFRRAQQVRPQPGLQRESVGVAFGKLPAELQKLAMGFGGLLDGTVEAVDQINTILQGQGRVVGSRRLWAMYDVSDARVHHQNW